MNLPLAPLMIGIVGVAGIVPVTPDTVYEKSRVLLLGPAAFGVTSATGAAAVNLELPDPKAVWVFTGGSASVTVDLGADTEIDMVMAGYALLAAGATWSIGYATAANPALGAVLQANTIFQCASDAIGPRVHGFYYRDTGPVVARYVTINIANAGITEAQLGTLSIGKALRFQWGIEWDNLHRVIDRGSRTELLSGGFGIRKGAKVRMKSYPFGDITDAELRAIDIIEMQTGNTAPIIVVSDYARTLGLNERITYGLFDTLEDRGRKGVNFAKWTLKVVEWR
jgi:hypothetical protein